MQTENESYESLFSSHLGQMIERLRAVPPDRWEWTPAPAAPSPRIVAEHTWNWLISDRQHLEDPDVTCHPHVPDAPSDQQALCDALNDEMGRWRTLILAQTPDQLAESRFHFGIFPRNVRFMIVHIVQQVIYKHGQLSTLFFALGLDGESPYTAPFPNEDYDKLADISRRPLHRAILSDDMHAVKAAITEGCDIRERNAFGDMPLKLAVMHNRAATVAVLLEHGADGNEADADGNTLLLYACFCGHTEAAKTLIESGVDLQAGNRWGATPLNCAEFKNNPELAAFLRQAGAV